MPEPIELYWDLLDVSAPPCGWRSSTNKWDKMHQAIDKLAAHPEKTMRIIIPGGETQKTITGAAKRAARRRGIGLKTRCNVEDGQTALYLQAIISQPPARKEECAPAKPRRQFSLNQDGKRARVRCAECRGLYVGVPRDEGGLYPYAHRVNNKLCKGVHRPGEPV